MELFTGTTESGLVIENGIVKNGKNCEGEITVPQGITGIGAQAFYQNKKLTGLTLPEGVKSIGKYAVNGCVNLEYMDVPESVDKVLKEMKEKDGWDKSHSNEHVVEVVYR